MGKIAIQANDPDKRRWPITTLVRLAVSLCFIGCIIWWMGGVGKIGAIVSRISFRFATLILILCTLESSVDGVQMGSGFWKREASLFTF